MEHPGNESEGGYTPGEYALGAATIAGVFLILCKYATVVREPTEQELLDVLDRSPGVPPGVLVLLIGVFLCWWAKVRLDNTGHPRE